MRRSRPWLHDEPWSARNGVPHPKPGLCLREAILVNHPGGFTKAPSEWTRKCLDQKLDPSCTSLMSPTLLPPKQKDPQLAPHLLLQFLALTNSTSSAKACTVWGSCLPVCKRSSWPWQKYPMNHKSFKHLILWMIRK